MRIEYHPDVGDELVEIRDFYESRSVGLGSDFVAEFERQVLRVAAMPERWMVVRGGYSTFSHEALSICDLFQMHC